MGKAQVILKSDISEPTLISHTSTVNTVDLPIRNDGKAGEVPTWYSQPVLPPVSPLEGYTISKRGHVLDAEGDVIGKLF